MWAYVKGIRSHRFKNKVNNSEVYRMAAKGPRESIILECTDCKRRNYTTSKNKRNNTERLTGR